MIQALFFDIDGTLISFRTHQVPASTIEALSEARARGIRIFIATGRPAVIINHLEPLQERNLIDGYITMNGAYCTVGDEVIYKCAIPEADVQALTTFCDSRRIPCIVVGEHDICAFQSAECIDRIFHQQLNITAPIPPVSRAEATNKQVFQLTPFINIDEEREVSPSIPNSELGRWHPEFVDITAKGNTKQQGIDHIIRHFHIPLEATMAFGDGGNDIPMLRHAAVGIAMGNARDNVKAVADYVTTSVDDDGIANALKHYGIID